MQRAVGKGVGSTVAAGRIVVEDDQREGGREPLSTTSRQTKIIHGRPDKAVLLNMAVFI